MENNQPFKPTSYSEILNTLNSQTNHQEAYSLLDVYIENIWENAWTAHQITRLQEKINEALDSNNKPLFLDLTAQYIRLIRGHHS